TARLVNLQRRLARVEDQRLDAARALRRGGQGDRLLADALAVAIELHRGDVLVATGALVPPERIRIRPVLNFVWRGGRCLDAGAGFVQLLCDEGALGRGEHFALPEELHRALANADAFDRAHRRVGAE